MSRVSRPGGPHAQVNMVILVIMMSLVTLMRLTTCTGTTVTTSHGSVHTAPPRLHLSRRCTGKALVGQSLLHNWWKLQASQTETWYFGVPVPKVWFDYVDKLICQNWEQTKLKVQMWKDLLSSTVDVVPREQTWRERDEVLPVQPLPKPVQEEGEAWSAHSEEAQWRFWVWNLWKEVSGTE